MAFYSDHNEAIGVTPDKPIYESELGASAIIVECVEFEREIFEECIKSDIQSLTMIKEGATDEEVSSFEEVSVKKIATKAKDFVIKIWNRIKLWFKGIYAKVMARLGSDNEKFYKKFKSEVKGKKLDGLEVKFKKANISVLDVDKNIDLKAAIDKYAETEDVDGLKKELLNGETNTVDFKNEIKDKFFDAEQEVAYTSISSEVESVLNGGAKDFIKKLKDAETSFNNDFATAKKKLDEETLKVNNASKIISKYSSIKLDIIKTYISLYKEHVSQCRKAFAKAVAYNPKSESAFEEDFDLVSFEADSL